MIVDGRSKEVCLDTSARIAIVGSGPAGLTLAHRLAVTGPIMVVESGGLETTSGETAPGETAGLPYPLAQTRARRFGGSSNLWAGYCAPLEPDDFTARAWLPLSGWPVLEHELSRHAAGAAAILNLQEPEFDIDAIAAKARVRLPFEGLVPGAWRFCVPKLDFGEEMRAAVEGSKQIAVLLNTQAVEIRLDRSETRVESICLRSSDGREGHLRADIVVLAGGGLETPRLLLASDRQMPNGIGNADDMVGRCFMEHPHVVAASFVPKGQEWICASTDRTAYQPGREFMLALGLDRETRSAAEILNARAHAFRRNEDGLDVIRLGIMCEQAPNPASRVTLAGDADVFGMRRLRLDWQLTEIDRRTHSTTAELLRDGLVRLGLGKWLKGSASEAVERDVGYCNHHIGTTRMSDCPEQGVVDSDCRVWGTENLYVAGSSVFPTGGWANPTFSIIALTLRLADHLNRRLS